MRPRPPAATRLPALTLPTRCCATGTPRSTSAAAWPPACPQGVPHATPRPLRPSTPIRYLHLRLRAGQVGMDDLRPLAGENLPVTGSLDAQLQADGPIHALAGSGWVELDNGSVYGEPMARIRAQGNIANQTIDLTSLTVSEDAGKIAATGSYDLSSRHFQLDAKGEGIDVARIETLRRHGLAMTGKLGFTVQGTGTLDDPRLEAHATLAGLALSGEPLGSVELTAHTANRSVTYDLTTRLEAAELTAHGQTALSGDYATQAKLDFSRFNIGALFRLAHVKGLSGESALAGTVTLEGPLARPERYAWRGPPAGTGGHGLRRSPEKRGRRPSHPRPCHPPSRSFARNRRADRSARPGQPVAQGQAANWTLPPAERSI